jgi:integral membrane protein
MLKTSVGRLRLSGMIEGLSFLVLTMAAMPMKYIYGDPSWVKVVGQAHGLLWIVFVFTLIDAKSDKGWTIKQALIPFIASMLPFGPFLVDRKIKEDRL